MAGTSIQVRSYGARLVARHIAGVAKHAQDIRPAGPAVTRRVAEGYARSFDRQGPGWSPLKPSTVRSRIAEGYSPGPILNKSGAYRSAAVNPTRLIVIEHNDGFDFIVAHDVAKYHQGGTRRMKARPIRLSFGDKIALANAINNWIISGYDKA